MATYWIYPCLVAFTKCDTNTTFPFRNYLWYVNNYYYENSKGYQSGLAIEIHTMVGKSLREILFWIFCNTYVTIDAL